MLRKILLTIMVISSFAYSEMINFNVIEHRNGAITVKFHSGENSHLLGEKDWIAIYPKESNTNWENVITWSWVNRVPVIGGGYINYDAANLLSPGKYEIRYFKNNSYTIYKAFPFTVKKIDSWLSNIFTDKLNGRTNILISGFKKDVAEPNEKDWIGIYKKSDNNDWGNVIEWIWAKDAKEGNFGQNLSFREMYLTPNKYYADQEYEARYFLNNSFKTYKAVTFTVERRDTIYFGKTNYRENGAFTLTFQKDDPVYVNSTEDWIAIYPKDSTTDWKNVIRWAWAKDLPLFNDKKTKYYNASEDLPKGEYEIRYFQNNSYTIHKSFPLTIH